jgi:uncharacterized membrane protein YbhN (UPF0104 family)
LTTFLPSLLGLGLFGLSLWTLRQELQHYSPTQIWQALTTIPQIQIWLALGLTGLNYTVFTGYDTLAARYAGCPLPYRRTALAAVLSTAVSNSVGLALLSGSAIRYRLYAAWGVAPVEIAQIIAFCQIGFWLGLFAVGSLMFLSRPVVIPVLLHLPFRSVQSVGVLFLAGLLAYLLWTLQRRRALQIAGFTLPHLPLRLALQQIGLGSCDWLLAATILYSLLPFGAVPYASFFAIYLLGQFAGLISNIPGGLGVFETVLLLLLEPQMPASTLLGTLLAYRIIYYLLPLVAAMTLWVWYELRPQR